MRLEPRRRTVAAAAAGSVASGFPLYLVLDRLGWLPVALRDRPWPLEIVSLAAALATLALAWRALRVRRGRAVAIPCAALVLAAAVGFSIYTRQLRYRLPAPPAGLALGTAVDFTLPDERGRPVQLASLRGHPVLLYFYRGGW